MTKIIQNAERYLTPNIVEQCFIKGKTLTVDKQVAGNGFSTAFLNLTIPEGMVNIIIAPNKAVLTEKQKAYKNQRADFKNRIKFFYQESKDDDFNEADVLFFVADSFLSRRNSILNIVNKVDKVLIDEAHSTEIQSLFRSNLVDFDTKVKEILSDSDTSITKITASPNLYSKADIFINNTNIPKQEIIVSSDREKAVERIKADIKNEEKVLLFTNASTVIYKLRDYKGEVKANFVIGNNLSISISELFTIKQDDTSNLIISSSRGYEGWDDKRDDVKVYVFEDRANDWESLFLSNLYQAISRTRKGAKRIEYCRQEVSNRRKEPFKDIDLEVNRFILDTSLSTEKKLNSDHKKYHDYVVFSKDSTGVFSVKRNDVSIGLHKEAVLFDNPFPSPEFKDFINQRKLTFKGINEVNNRLTKKVRISQKIKNLKSNAEFLKAQNLFGDDFKLKVENLNTHKETDVNGYRKLYLSHLEEYLRRKNYNGDYIHSMREARALRVLKSKNEFKKIVVDITKAFDVRSISKYGLKGSAEARAKFKIKGVNYVGMLVCMFTNKRISLPKKVIVHRDYNLITKIGIDELEYMGMVFETDVLEIDIRNCFPRVLYALCKKQLPKDFYGKDKELKTKINIFLNDFMYKKESGTDKKSQKSKAKRKFQEFGFDKDVINYLMDNYFDCKYRGDLFNRLSFHESEIIKTVKEIANLNNDGVLTRHDSLIVFGNKADLTFLNDFTYLNRDGWFDVKATPVFPMSIDDHDLLEGFKDAI